MLLIRWAALYLLVCAVGPAANPVYQRNTGSQVALGNDYLERIISVSDGAPGTVELRNKITGREYVLGGPEFELRLVYERVGYDFGSENPLVINGRGMHLAGRDTESLPDGGNRLVLHLAPVRDLAVDLVYELKPNDFFTRQWLRVSKPKVGTYFIDSVAVARNSWGLPHFSLGGFGQPLFGDDIFLGMEFPTSLNEVSGSDVALGGYVGVNIPPEGYTSEPAVMGVTPAGLVHQQFLEYVNRMRVAPVRPYLLYNSWYDLQRLAMNHDNTLERVPALQKLLLGRFGLHLDSFVLDDGWDDMHRLWAIDPERFPTGFGDLAGALRGIGSGLGMWFGPIGGYNQRAIRIANARPAGMEVTSNGQYLCIAGTHYGRLLADTMLRYQKDYGVNYYKLDGIPFGCNEPDHGHPTGIYSREASARVFVDMLQRLRARDPKVFLNITTSIWLSPWWLRYADTVWMGGEDSGYLAAVPAMAPRQSAISYRDSVLYDDFVTHQAQFPMSSLMTHGIIKGKYNMLGGNRELVDDWRDEVVHYYSVGNMMYEFYISPDILSADEMDALGNATRWAQANADPLLANSTMVLGDPAAREPYGFVHSTRRKSIVTLRNPFVRPRTVRLPIDALHGFEKDDRPLTVEVVYPYRAVRPGRVHFGDTMTFDLSSYEQIVCELQPAAGDVAEAPVAHPADEHVGPTLGAPLVHTEGRPGAARSVHVNATVDVPAGYREVRVAFLIEPRHEARDVTAVMADHGKNLDAAAENGGHGVWHWFWAELTAGRHVVEFTVQLPPGAGETRISGWLLTRHTVASSGNERAENLLPTSGMKRHTYTLMEETIP